jgi:8-oxo-dGTP pyrophosphatase MutT (NUDIX family)
LNVPPAVVGLVVSYDGSNSASDLRFLLTLRSFELKHHSGQVGLPGGLVEESERSHPLRALDREMEEEVGIRMGTVEWVDKPWESLISRHGIPVDPYLGFWDRTQGNLQISSNEVSDFDWLDLASLFDPDLWRVRRFVSWQEEESVSRDLPIWIGWKHVTWGLTAGFLAYFVRRISGRPPIGLRV